jgi:hypothetical protein
MVRSEDAQKEEQDSQSLSESSLTTFSVRNPIPEQLLATSLEQARIITESEVQTVTRSFVHLKRRPPISLFFLWSRAPERNTLSYANPVGKAPILPQDYSQPPH